MVIRKNSGKKEYSQERKDKFLWILFNKWKKCVFFQRIFNLNLPVSRLKGDIGKANTSL